MRARAICVCRDEAVGQVVETALAAADIEVEHHAALPAEPGEVALFVVDRGTREAEADARRAILRRLSGRGGDTVWMQPPFFCD